MITHKIVFEEVIMDIAIADRTESVAIQKPCLVPVPLEDLPAESDADQAPEERVLNIPISRNQCLCLLRFNQDLCS